MNRGAFIGEVNLAGISADWNPQLEASFFLRLVRAGTISFRQAKHDILMQPRQLAWLKKQWPHKEYTLQRIYNKRQETWKSFLKLCIIGHV